MLLEAKGLRRTVADKPVFSDLAFTLSEGTTLAVLGESGSGKTLLLRALAWLDPLDAGGLWLHGKQPSEHGIPAWRRRVTYVAQQAPSLHGTPGEHALRVGSLKAQEGVPSDDPIGLGRQWGLAAHLWDRPWSELSGGERQRAYLAVAVARRPDVLLLDEPTSALDAAATLAVERTLQERACVWVTHDVGQAERVAHRRLELHR